MADPQGASSAKDDARSKEEEAMEAERRFGRYVALGLPTATVLGAIAACLFFSMGPALLVMIGGVLLGTIALFWASLRTLSGDAPLPLALEAMAAQSRTAIGTAEQKRRVMRALKDLEAEHAIGKIDDADYAEVAERYRNEAKQLMRDMDEQVDPLRERAEEIARAHLKKRKIGAGFTSDEPAETTAAATESSDDLDGLGLPDGAKPAKKSATPRVACAKCDTSNETDAAFCKKCGASLVVSPKENTDAPA